MSLTTNLLFYICLLALIGIIYSLLILSSNNRSISTIALLINLILFQGSLIFISFIDYTNVYYTLQSSQFDSFNNLVIKPTNDILWRSLVFGLDTISIIFIIITILLISYSLVIGSNTRIFGSIKFFTVLLQIIQIMLIILFSTTDLFIFYLTFEGLTIPTFFLIFLYGAEITKLRAAKLFLIYSFLSSTCLGLALSLFYIQFQTSNLNQLLVKLQTITLTSEMVTLSTERYIFIYLLLLIGFGVKIPLAPFHMWLPEAHAEASTPGSVILAGLILKLGGYGIIRFILPLFGSYTLLNPYIQTTCIIGIIFVSCSCLRTTNLKQIIAYTSIIHMNITTIGLFSQQTISVVGSFISMISHSLVASGLFICAGTLYNRFGVYEIQYFGGLSQTMPIFSALFAGLTLANIALPLTLAFIGEFTVLITLLNTNIFIFVILTFLTALNTIYALWVLNRLIYTDIISFQNLNSFKKQLLVFQDLDTNEIYILSSLLMTIFWFGIIPNLLISNFSYIY